MEAEGQTPPPQNYQRHHLPPDPDPDPYPYPDPDPDPLPPPPTKVIPMNKGPPPPPPCSHSSSSGASKRAAVCTCITVFLLLAGITLLVLWLVYRPYKPRFTVVGAAIYGLNATSPPLLSATLQFNVLIRNPNRRVSVYCDRFSAFVTYRNQAITPQVVLPPLYLEKHSQVSLSPVIGGTPLPVSLEVTNGLMVDEAYGVVGLKLVFVGRLRWKAGAIRTAHYGLYVKCDVLMGLKKGFVGQVPLLGTPACDVDI